jgi:hypothetical protein
MRERERAKALKKLDEEQWRIRAAARKTPAREGWLRDIRLALGVPLPEVVRKSGIHRSEIYREEGREVRKRISLWTLERMADALDCRLVYAVIPKRGSFEDLSLRRAWRVLLEEEETLGVDGRDLGSLRDRLRRLKRMAGEE